MAWHYKQYQDAQSPAERGAYAAAECLAMKARIGLWSDPHPVQPQDWRHQRMPHHERADQRSGRGKQPKPRLRVAVLPLLRRYLLRQSSPVPESAGR